ncbi:MAG: adenosylcobinamide-GDP ribazoletransferase [Moritella sp.]|uniref:adenosylcobinamide-GDP ribazoletransferase n=1 Tax=Moritella sp. TaxID=78556 RepID=UPI001D34CCB9|nr:adenosylcobinamide-GDP ribazoletransferase [Moritella sp.]NQZ50722.1 adenosylcobinamide-GDP ribazoletransferase [Moritella sp.]
MMNRLRAELELFWLALGFFSRIPVPANLDFSAKKLNQSCRYFPVVGWLIGGCGSAVYYVTQLYFSVDIAILFVMLTGVLLTGAFHEDGLIDSADGLGGGWTREQKLMIMKDSRIGSYGSIAIWFVLAIKFALLSSYSDINVSSYNNMSVSSYTSIMLALFIAHPLSRTVATVMMFISPYVRETADTKSKPVVEPKHNSDLVISLLLGLLPLLLLPELILPMLFALVIFVFCFRHFVHKQVGGITGDLLGLAQQLSELLIYMVLIIGLQG